MLLTVPILTDPAFNNNKSYPLDNSIELSGQLGELFDSGKGCDFTLTFSYPPGDSLEVETLEAPADNTKESVCVHSLVLSLFPKFVTNKSIYEMDISLNCRHYIREFVRYDVNHFTAQILVSYQNVL